MMIVYLDNTPFPINLEKVIAFLIPLTRSSVFLSSIVTGERTLSSVLNIAREVYSLSDCIDSSVILGSTL